MIILGLLGGIVVSMLTLVCTDSFNIPELSDGIGLVSVAIGVSVLD
jgi:hypothetical protein